jgi:Ca2+-binding RTX toxin-like protein
LFTRCPSIVIQPTDATGETVTVTINGQRQPGGPFTGISHIIVYGQGADDIEINKLGNDTVAIGAVIFGGTGNSTLSVAGSSANNIVVGGPGNNTLRGGLGRDILIGGTGQEMLHAGQGDDILIGGGTIYDGNVTALLALMVEWASTDTYRQRVQDLFGDTSGGANGGYLLDNQSYRRANAIDQLFGAAEALDWFLFSDSSRAPGKIAGYSAGEVATME